MSRAVRTTSLVRRLIFNLAITVGLLLVALVLSFIIGFVFVNNQKNIDQKRLMLATDSAELLRTMLDQETGLRGYISTAEETFLEPYNSGRTQYNEIYRKLLAETIDSNLNSTAQALGIVNDRANIWSTQFAQTQIDRIKRGEIELARRAQTDREGKTRFDELRRAFSDLNQAIERDLFKSQQDAQTFQITLLVLAVLVALIGLFFIWRTSIQFVNGLRSQLTDLMEVTDQLEEGDLSARIKNPTSDELGRLAQNFNSMADALQSQQEILKERDIQTNVLQLNTTLNSSLELDELLTQFLQELSSLLNIQVATIYLYDVQSNTLTLNAHLGLDQDKLLRVFRPGEGTLGNVALTHKPILVQRPEANQLDSQSFALKTIFGQIIPSSLYYQPLESGSELLGVLMVATLYPMAESTRNVVNVISSGLSSVISNALAYRHIQSQAEELERRKTELERNNQQLSRHRDELATLNSALEEANRLRSQFLSTMSHELRTPLTAIIGFSQLSLRKAEVTNLTQRQQTNLEHILRNGQNLLNLVNDVLDISKIEAGRMDVRNNQVKLGKLFSQLVDENQPLWFEKHLEVKYQVDPKIDKIETDPDRLHQILLNLLGNAIKFTEKGSITLVAAPRPSQNNRMNIADEMVAISVVDTGIGIAVEVQNRIFEEFYQADSSTTRKYGGTGLGLSIVHKLTDLLGGQVELKSQPGAGSTFTIVLPRHAYARTSAPSDSSTTPQLPTINMAQLSSQLDKTTPSSAHSVSIKEIKKIKKINEIDEDEIIEGKHLILAIDDDPDVLTLIRGTLEDTEYHVVGLLEAPKALETARRLNPYAITLDVMMPELNGWQILQQLKGDPTTAHIPIIMLTVVSDRSAGYVLGASDYLVKPVQRENLLTTLERLAQRRMPVLQTASGEAVGIQPAQPDTAPKGPPHERRYILVVDDERDIRDVLAEIIADADYQVKTAAGGYEALRLIEEEPPGLILLDLMMPDLDGFEVLERLKANPRTAAIPVVIQTAKTLTNKEREQLKLGAARIIQKGSVPLEKLVDELNHLLKKD